MGFFSKGRFGRKLVVAGATLSVCGGAFGYVVYQRRLKENKSCTAEVFNAQQDQAALHQALVNITAKDASKRPETLLYRYTTCPFCGTVKAFLDVYGINHNCVEVEPMLKGEFKEMAYKKVPQLQFVLPGNHSTPSDHGGKPKGPMLVDSGIIVETLAPLVGAGKQLQDEDIKKWRSWARNQLVRLLVLDINRSLPEAWRAYSYIDQFDTIPYANKLFLKVMGAPVMYLVAQNFTKPKLVKSGDLKAGDDVRERLHEEVNRFVAFGLVDAKTGKPKRFHGGDAPDLADIDAYGVLQSIRGHRVYNDILRSTQVQPWLDAMDAVTKKSKYEVPKE